jgi:hypothetical protein
LEWGVELKEIRRVSFESPVWKKDDTFRGIPAFGMRVYELNFTEFTTTDLARSKAEEKMLKKIAKAQEAKLEKQKDRKGGKKNPYFQPAKSFTVIMVQQV